ncbi:MAG TPA: tetratricopeptide repeat protein [Trueperaceae bacterium]
MKQPSLSRSLICVLLLALLSAAMAAQPVRPVILPFNAPGGASAYTYGLATALQRSLNVIDGVYAPPVGDSYFVTQRLLDRKQATPDNILAAFDGSVLISGQVAASGNTATVQIGFDGPDYQEVKLLTVRGALDNPDDIVLKTVNSVVAELGLTITAADRQQLDAVTAQTPSLPSLTAVGQAALRLPGSNLNDLRTAAQLDGNSSWVLAELARAQLLQGDDDEALATSLKAIQAGPNDIEALVTRGAVLSSTGDDKTALQAFDAALQLNPAHALALQGKAQLTAGTQKARALYDEALASYPRLVDAYLGLAELENQQSPQKAIQVLMRGAKAVPDSLVLRRAVVRQALRLGDAGGALSYLQGELKNPEARSPGLYALAMELPRPDYAKEALKIVRQGRADFPDSQTLARAEATLLEEQGDLAGAEAALQNALDTAKGAPNPALLNDLAVVQARQGELEAAEATLAKAPGNNDTLQYNLAKIYLNAGQSQAAVSVLEKLVQRTPNDAGAFALYGVALGRLGRYDQALNALDQALALDPKLALAKQAKDLISQQQNLTGGQAVALEGEAAAAFQRGLASLEQGDARNALMQFSHALDLQDNGLIAFYKGYALQLTGDLRGAVKAYQRALEEYPDSDIVLNNLGLAQRNLGRYDLALQHFRDAVEANPDNPDAQLNLGLTNFELGRYQEAAAALQEAIRINPSFADLKVGSDESDAVTLAQLVERAKAEGQ